MEKLKFVTMMDATPWNSALAENGSVSEDGAMRFIEDILCYGRPGFGLARWEHGIVISPGYILTIQLLVLEQIIQKEGSWTSTTCCLTAPGPC